MLQNDQICRSKLAIWYSTLRNTIMGSYYNEKRIRFYGFAAEERYKHKAFPTQARCAVAAAVDAQ